MRPPVIAKLAAKSDSRAVARVSAGPGAVERLLAVARRFAPAAGLSGEAADRLAVVVEEWTANIVEHGDAASGSLIALNLEQAGGVVRATFTDAGVAFDPRDAAHAGPNPERGGGAGIALMCAWSEVEAYRRRGGRNRLVLRLRS